MPIVISPELLKHQAGQMEHLMGQYDSLFGKVTTTLNSVNNHWSDNLSHNFSSKIDCAQKSFSSIIDSLQLGVNAANNSANSFEDIDTSLSKYLRQAPLHSVIIKGGTIADSKRQSFWDHFKELISDSVEHIKLGVATVITVAKDTVATWIDIYQSKGWVYKLINTGVAIAKIASSIASCFLVIPGEIGLFALGPVGIAFGVVLFPVTVAAVLANWNTVLNSSFNLYNLWFGDIEQVGTIDVMKSHFQHFFGEEKGNTVDKVTKVVALLTNLVFGLVKYATSLPKVLSNIKDYPEALGTLIDAAVHDDIKFWGATCKLIEYVYPGFWATLKAGKSIFKTSYKVTNTLLK